MHGIWWELPGPATFTSLMIDSLRQGKSVVVGFPENYPPGLRQAVASLVSRDGQWHWRAIRLRDENEAHSPARVLARRFSHKLQGGHTTAAAIAGMEELSGCIVWIDDMTEELWPYWKSFLSEFALACRTLDSDYLPSLCVPVVGSVSNELPAREPNLDSRRWRGCVSRLDMLILISRLLEARRMPNLHRQIALAVSLELSAFDPLLAERLCESELEELIEPADLLREYARSKDWLDPIESNWALGTLDTMDGREIVHSAALSISGDERAVIRRVWRGQVGVLFPFIEEQRVRLLSELSSHLRLPMETDFGVLKDPLDLEIGHIFHQVRRVGLRKETRELLRLLKDMRHALAHLRPVAFSALSAKEVIRASG